MPLEDHRFAWDKRSETLTIHRFRKRRAVLGWLWFDQPLHWHLDARARQVTRAVALEVKALIHKCEADHDLGYELMKRYAHHLAVQFRVTKLQLVDMYGT